MSDDNQKTKDPKRPELTNGETSLLQIHLAEYNALMARNTSSMHWQWMMFAAAIVFLTFLASAWSQGWIKGNLWLASCGAVLIQISVVLANTLTWGQYQKVLYIEKFLRPCVDRILSVEPIANQIRAFWGYESYLVKQRDHYIWHGVFLWWEWLSTLIALIVLFGLMYIYHSLSSWDPFGLCVNGEIILFLIYKTHHAVKLRSEWVEHLKATSHPEANSNANGVS